MNKEDFKNGTRIVLAGALALVLFLGIIMGGIAGFKAFNRSQHTADAKNNANIALIHANNTVKVTDIEIRNQKQRIQVTKQQAQIRYEQSVGVRKAQDEIAKTLTALYVQFEMIQAMEDIAKSGKNNTVIYVPSGEAGVPTITAKAGTGK